MNGSPPATDPTKQETARAIIWCSYNSIIIILLISEYYYRYCMGDEASTGEV